MKRKLTIFQYGSQLNPTDPAFFPRVKISISESSPSERSCSMEAPKASNSSTFDFENRGIYVQNLNIWCRQAVRHCHHNGLSHNFPGRWLGKKRWKTPLSKRCPLRSFIAWFAELVLGGSFHCASIRRNSGFTVKNQRIPGSMPCAYWMLTYWMKTCPRSQTAILEGTD